MLKGKTITPSNVLSIFRVLLLFPVYQGLSQNTTFGNLWALVFMALAVLSDFLDGFLARRLGQISDLGKILDPVADKICIVSVCLMLTSANRSNPLPHWFLFTIILRDVAVLLCGYLIYHRRAVVATSNIWGKTTSVIMAAMLIVYVMQVEEPPLAPWLPAGLSEILLWLALSFMIVSTGSYAWHFYQMMSERKNLSCNSSVLHSDTGKTPAQQNGTNS